MDDRPVVGACAHAWRAASAICNLVRLGWTEPMALISHPAKPWERQEDDLQFAGLFERYPVVPLESAGVVVGILKGFDDQYRKYEKACAELGVDCRMINLTRASWLDELRAAPCDGYVCHPTAYTQPWKAMFEERLKIIEEELGKAVHPGAAERWPYESKRRMAYWLEANGVPHPCTRVFYEIGEALAFAEQAEYPLIFKTDLGSSASGVRLLRRPTEAFRLVAGAFAGGLRGKGRDPRDREWGSILFQEYVEGAREFRVAHFGNSWFGHEKIAHPETGFHSGSGDSAWNVPPEAVFDFCRELSARAGFRAMNYDVFVDRSGRLLVNELQAVFAAYNPSQMYRDGVPGRMRFEEGAWRFEEGLFCRNGCANLRVEELVAEIRRKDG